METVLEGISKITVDEKDHIVKTGETCNACKKPHALFVEEVFKIMLVVIFLLSK